MSRFRKFLIAGVVAAVAIPAGVVFAGFDGSETFAVDTQTYASTGSQTTNSSQFQELPDLQLSATGIGEHITISAEMTSGKARFKLQSADFDPGAPPVPTGGVLFTGPGANSYAFYNRDACHSYSVLWKKVGSKPAKMARASAEGIGLLGAC